MPRSVNGNVGSSPNYKDHREKLFNLTVSLNKLPESLDLHKGSINLGKTHVYRKFMHPKWNRRSSQTVRTCQEQKHTYRNKHLTHCESMQVESRQNSLKRCMCTLLFIKALCKLKKQQKHQLTWCLFECFHRSNGAYISGKQDRH